MDMDDFSPAGGGSLRGVLRPGTREPVATFTQTRALHPDEIWHPRGGELTGTRPERPGSREDRRKAGHQGKTGHQGTTPHEEVARMVRAALRPGG
jgi:hypothetical protein